MNHLLDNALSFAHLLLKNSISASDTVIDATAGKGKDTLMLSKAVGETGKVLAFDIQEEAIEITRQYISKKNRRNVKLFHADHSLTEEILQKEEIYQLGGAVFNLGYLPGSSKTVITNPESTIQALSAILSRLKTNALAVLVVYHGHSGGKREKEDLTAYCQNLDQNLYQVLKYEFINQKNDPPLLLAIEKRGKHRHHSARS